MTALKSYLTYYASLFRPGFAVLVTGPWGVGKTHQVKKAIGKESCYISLFGMKSENEVHSAVLMGMYPPKKRAKVLSDLLRGTNLKIHDISIPAGSIAANALDTLLFSEIDADRTIVFDDLERSSIPSRVLLGIIDKYLQLLRCKVVVIAHDGELPDRFSKHKEKLFGQTIAVKPDLSEAYESFVAAYDGAEKAIILQYRAEIEGVFKESQVNSLRILQQMISDLVRLYRCLSDEHVASGEFISGLFKWFVALSSQARAGLLVREDLYNRKTKLIAIEIEKLESHKSGTEAPENRLLAAVQKFNSTDLTYNPLEDDVVIEMIFDGVYEKVAVQSALKENPFFTTSKQVPAWRSLMEWDNLSEEQIKVFIERLHAEFKGREINQLGDILHMFAFELMFSVSGIDGRTQDEVISAYKEYMDDLLDMDAFPTVPDLSAYHYGFKGFSYWVLEESTMKFSEFWKVLPDYIASAWKRRMPKIRSDLLEALQARGDEFKSILSGSSIFENVPVLQAIDPSEFVDSMLELHPRKWGDVAKVLSTRKSKCVHDPLFREEAEWLARMEERLRTKMETSEAIRSAKIGRALAWMNRAS